MSDAEHGDQDLAEYHGKHLGPQEEGSNLGSVFAFLLIAGAGIGTWEGYFWLREEFYPSRARVTGTVHWDTEHITCKRVEHPNWNFDCTLR